MTYKRQHDCGGSTAVIGVRRTTPALSVPTDLVIRPVSEKVVSIVNGVFRTDSQIVLTDCPHYKPRDKFVGSVPPVSIMHLDNKLLAPTSSSRSDTYADNSIAHSYSPHQ